LLSLGAESFAFTNTNIKVHRIVILPVVLYGCEACSLTLSVEHRLRALENRELRIFGPKRDKITWGVEKTTL
jgi:hypothetical protein